MPPAVPTGEAALAAGWDWLTTLPRAAVAHARRGRDPLASVRQLLAALGDPHERLRVIHIAGSKGKGSTALLIETLLAGCNQSTFTYTSPHLQRWTERLRIGAAPADPATALQALEAVRQAQRDTGVKPGFFEALTVAGLWLAATREVDWAIVEAGVGGRADATNVVRPRATLVTGIELEHADRLGGSLAAIAREKSGIVKPGAPLLAPALAQELDAVLAAAAEQAGVEFVRLRRRRARARRGADPADVGWHHDGRVLDVAGAGWAIRAPFTGAAPMAGNAALAIAAVARLGLASQEDLQRAARMLAGQSLPGRMEILSTRPWIMVDGAHTRASAEALAAEVRRLAPARLHLLLSVTAGKDVAALAGPLLPLADAVTVTRADPDYSLPAGALAEAVRAHAAALPVVVESDPEAALARAGREPAETTLVLATGSVYLAGRIRGLLAAAEH